MKSLSKGVLKVGGRKEESGLWGVSFFGGLDLVPEYGNEAGGWLKPTVKK